MEKAPTQISPETAQERITQIDKAIGELYRKINDVSAISEENRDTDDAGPEAADDQVSLGLIRQEIEELQRERGELEATLQK